MRIRFAVLLACVAGAATNAFAQCPPNMQAPVGQSPTRAQSSVAPVVRAATGYVIAVGCQFAPPSRVR